jgi:hypothetical protein
MEKHCLDSPGIGTASSRHARESNGADRQGRGEEKLRTAAPRKSEAENSFGQQRIGSEENSTAWELKRSAAKRAAGSRRGNAGQSGGKDKNSGDVRRQRKEPQSAGSELCRKATAKRREVRNAEAKPGTEARGKGPALVSYGEAEHREARKRHARDPTGKDRQRKGIATRSSGNDKK